MFMKKNAVRIATLGATLLLALSAMSGCARTGQAVDPATMGYTAKVTYDSLGGRIGGREVRKVSYMPNSLLFEPSGSTGLIVKPTRAGHVLAGWYTDMTESKGEDGKPKYEFKAQDRWDFNMDRVEDAEEITLYARWIEQGEAEYINGEDGEVLFAKNVTAESPVQELSSSILKLVVPDGKELEGYYTDKALTTPFEFETVAYMPLSPKPEDLWSQLAEEFPEYVVPFDETVATPTPEPVVETAVDGAEGEVLEGGVEDMTDLDPWLYVKKLGYDVVTEDEAAIDEIRARRNEIYEEHVSSYAKNTEGGKVYLKFSDGLHVMVESPEDLKDGKTYGFSDKNGQPRVYELTKDLDLSGIKMTMSPSFSGEIIGNGHTIKNLSLTVQTAKIEKIDEKPVALFESMKGGSLRDLTFENFSLKANLGLNIVGKLAPIAVNAEGATLENVHFSGVTIDTGRADKGRVIYEVADVILNPDAGTKLEQVTGEKIEIKAHETAKITRTLE